MKIKLLYLILFWTLIEASYSQTYNLQREIFYSASNYAANYLAVYDFNGDGLDDLLIGGNNGETLNKTPIYLLISQGDGTFNEERSNYVNGNLLAANPTSVNADYNQDGILDFAIFDSGHMELGQDPVYTGFYGEDAQLLLSNSNGSWDISTALSDAHEAANDFSNSELHIKSGSAADINNDGYPDIYVESGGGSQQLLSHIYYNNGDNSFSVGKMGEAIWAYPFSGPIGYWRQQANSLADINNDGFPDLLVGQLRRTNNEQEGLTSYVLLNDGNGNFQEEGAISLPHPNWHEGYTYVLSILTLDVNQDGWLDLIYSQHRGQDDMSNTDDAFTGYYIQVYINNNGTEFVDATLEYISHTSEMLSVTHPEYGFNINFGRAKLFDINEDGFDDIFITNGPPVDSNNPLILLNNGSNNFRPIPAEVYNAITNGNIWTGEYSYPIDLNGDGLLDMVGSDLTGGPDGEYGTGDEYHEIYPVFGIRNYPKVSNISISCEQQLASGLDLTFIPDLDVTHFYIEKIYGGQLYTSSQEIINEGNFIDIVTADSGFLFSPDSNFQGHAYFYIQGANAANTSNLVGSKFITKINVTCGSLSLKDKFKKIIFYPNPTTSIVTIEGGAVYNIEVYSLQGRKLMTHRGNSIDLSSLSNAMYLIKATNTANKQQQIYKVIKE